MTDTLAQVQLQLQGAQTAHDIDQIKSQYLGKSGSLNSELKTLKDLDEQDRREVGKKLNLLKKKIIELVAQAHENMKESRAKVVLAQADDVTVKARVLSQGGRHPISLAREHLIQFMQKHAFRCVEGPEIESEYYNFDCLNVPHHHPARQDHDTFYLRNTEYLLRTHTSPVQIRVLEKGNLPLRICSTGRVYRSDFDATHTPMFHQMEALVIDQKSNFSHLKYIIHKMLNDFFSEELTVRFRPAYFPFTEPSAEVDIKKGGQWLEVLGCGMVHPDVLDRLNIDSKKYQGYAFGCGIDRLAMIKYDLPDLRALFENELGLLSQFRQVIP